MSNPIVENIGASDTLEIRLTQPFQVLCDFWCARRNFERGCGQTCSQGTVSHLPKLL